MAIKKNDFVEIEFTGKMKEEDIIFDTTDKKTAQDNGLEQQQGMEYGPKVICVGQGQLLPGLEKDIEGKEPGKSYTVEIAPEDGFGKKSAKLVQLVPTKVFIKQQIQPTPGLQVNIDNNMGIIKTVSGGRTLVDFNHPLSSKELIYDYKINNIITDTKEKADSYIKMSLGLPLETEYAEGVLKAKLQFPLPDEIKQQIEEKTKEVIPEIKKIEFEEPKKEKDKPDKMQQKAPKKPEDSN